MRTCMICGKKMVAGMTDLSNFYTHEECLPAAMDKIYGKHQWMVVPEEQEDGGYYVAWIDGKVEDTGIFYTDWEDDDDVD